MKRLIGKVCALIVVTITLHLGAWSVDCPGFCTQCRTDAISLCGAGCISSYSCSLATCTCTFSCRPGCYPSLPKPALFLRDKLDLPKLTSSSWQSEGGKSIPNIRFEIVPQSEVPLTIRELTIRNDPGRQSSEIAYVLKNDTGSRLEAISLMVVFFNERNEPLGGEVLREHIALSPNEEHRLQTPLSHYVDNGQRVSLAFTSFQTDGQSWVGDHDPIIKAMKH